MKPSHLQFADDLMKHAQSEAHKISESKEEILRAFVAKHGFDPDHAIQITGHLRNGQTTWQVVHSSDVQIDMVRQSHLRYLVSKERLSLWKKLCLFMATGRWYR